MSPSQHSALGEGCGGQGRGAQHGFIYCFQSAGTRAQIAAERAASLPIWPRSSSLRGCRRFRTPINQQEESSLDQEVRQTLLLPLSQILLPKSLLSQLLDNCFIWQEWYKTN